MGISIPTLFGLPDFDALRRGGEVIGQKAGQAARWAGDQIGANPNYGRIDPRTIDTSRYDEDRTRQADLYKMLQAQASGTGPSMAQGLLQQATDQNINQAMALGAAQQGQGLGYASALRNIADQSAAARQQQSGQAALLKNQEMLQGQNSLMGLLSGMSGNDLTLGGQQAQLGLQYDLANQQAKLAQGNKLANVASGAGQGIASIATMGQKPPGMASGGMVDSPANDTVPIMASPGEIVLPVSVAQAPDAEQRAAEFVAEVRGEGPSAGPGAHLAKMEALEKRIAALEGKKRKAA